jgi:iron(III) transport system ATP-binding protein
VYLSLRHLTKTFGTLHAVDGVDLDIERSEFICILGPSGCGKTTLLRIVAGLERPDIGEFVFAGENYTHVPERLRNFGMVFQSYSLFPNLSVGENVAYGLRCRGWDRSKIGARVAEMLDLVGLSDQQYKYQSQLSGGQQQRVALARALAPSPHVLLLDEPLSALDAKVRRSLRQEIRKLQRALGITTIMVTHDQEEALTMADRVVVMERGRIVQTDVPAAIYDRPATPFVAEFIGQMNFIKAVASINGRARVDDVDLEYADTASSIGAGDELILSIRPEDIRLAPVSSGRTPVNSLWATVKWVEFLGNVCRASLTLRDDRSISAELAPNAAREMRLAEGQTLCVTLPPSSIRVFGA